MNLADDIALLVRQEELLQFKSLSDDQAWALGTAMRAKALRENLPLVMDIRLGLRPMFYVAMPGTTPENPDWVRRKVNTVYRFEKSSYRVALEHQLSGKPLDQSRGVNPLDYAAAGGGFPIRIAGSVVGAVTVSGIPQRQDHAFVAESLCDYLGIAYKEIALSSGSD
jgi:uncharacterized protein (UPF0303 family)